MNNTNTKNSPENAKYMTMLCYTDRKPLGVVKDNPRTKVLSPVLVAKDPEWKPDFHPGGFSAYCANQISQTWLYDGIDEEVQIRVYKTKRGWSMKFHQFVEDCAVHFYDYNF